MRKCKNCGTLIPMNDHKKKIFCKTSCRVIHHQKKQGIKIIQVIEGQNDLKRPHRKDKDKWDYTLDFLTSTAGTIAGNKISGQNRLNSNQIVVTHQELNKMLLEAQKMGKKEGILEERKRIGIQDAFLD